MIELHAPLLADKKYHVYVDAVSGGAPFYVGKGSLRRVQQPTRNKHHSAKTTKYHCVRTVVFSTDSEQEAFEMERVLIAAYRTQTNGCNYSSGGEGAAKDEVPLSTRARISKALTGKKKTKDHVANSAKAKVINSDDEILDIYNMRVGGSSYKEIGAKYGRSTGWVSRVVNGVSHCWVYESLSEAKRNELMCVCGNASAITTANRKKTLTGRKLTEHHRKSLRKPHTKSRKFSDDQIVEMYELRENGLTYKTIADRFKTDDKFVYGVVNGRYYKDVYLKYHSNNSTVSA